MEFLLDILQIFAFYLIIAFVWIVAENMIYGKTTPRLLDDVVAIILAISIFLNIR